MDGSLSEEQCKLLCTFAQEGNTQKLESLIKKLKPEIQLSPRDLADNAVSPLVLASQYNHLSVVKYLLNRFSSTSFIDWPCTVSDIANTEDELHHCTALNAACICGHTEIVQLLLEAGASQSIPDCTGATPFVEAVFHNRFKVLEILHKFGADVNATNSSGWNAFHIACMKRNKRVLQYLLDIGVDPTKTTPEGFAAMHIATGSGFHAVQFLLKHNIAPHSLPSSSALDYVPCPLYLAAFQHSSVYEVLSDQKYHPKSCLVNGLLLRGVHMLTSTKDTQQDTYRLWNRALTMAEESSTIVPALALIDSYGGRTEMTNVKDLRRLCEPSLPNSYSEMLYQALMIVDRCIGARVQSVCMVMVSLAQELLRLSYSKEVEPVFLRILSLVEMHQLPLLRDGQCLPQNFEMFYGELITKIISPVSKKASEEMEQPLPQVHLYLSFIFNVIDVFNSRVKALHNQYGCSLQSPKLLLQFTMKVFSDWLIILQDKPYYQLEEKWNELGKTFVSKFLRQPNGSNLVHTVLDAFHVYSPTFFERLLQWGANEAVNEPFNGKRCLQKACVFHQRSAFDILLMYGAHLDAVGRDGKTVMEIQPDIVTNDPLPLGCLAAWFIIKEELPYEHIMHLPPRIKKFVRMHDVRAQ